MPSPRLRKSNIGWKYQTVPAHGLFYVEGPGLENLVRCDSQADADEIAAALNFVANYENLKRDAIRIRDDLDMFATEYK